MMKRMKKITKIPKNILSIYLFYIILCSTFTPRSSTGPLTASSRYFICLLWCCEKRGKFKNSKMSKKRTRTTTAASNKGSKKPRVLPSSPHGPFWNGTTTDPEIITVLVNNRDEAFHYDAETSRLDLVQEVWEHEIIPFFNVKELAMLRPTCRWCDEQWQEFLKRNTFRVPEEVPTIDEAMRVGFNLSKQKVFSKEKPLVVVLSEGEHVVEGSWTDSIGTVFENTLGITCSNISFIGQGKDKTTVHGGIFVLNKKNVTFEEFDFDKSNLAWFACGRGGSFGGNVGCVY